MSRTLHPTLRLALPLILSAPVALWACSGNRTFTPTPESTPDSDPPADTSPPPPSEGPVFVPDSPPPAISGGTLVALNDGITAVAADPDRDLVWVVDTQQKTLRGSIALKAGDEPGRGVEDGAGQVWIALRRGGAVVTLDVAAMTVTRRAATCAEPRGIAYDPAADQIHVACASGELVSFAAATGVETRRLRLDRDLRDVIVAGAGLRVSRFRSAELLGIDAAGAVTSRVTPPSSMDVAQRPFDAAVAWRTIALPGGGVATLHQRGLAAVVPPFSFANAYYADPCSVIVHAAVTVDDPGSPQSPLAGRIQVALGVDMAIAPDGKSMAIAAAGDRVVVETTLADLESTDSSLDCQSLPGATGGVRTPVEGTPIAVAYDAAGELLVQTREPPSVWIFGRGQIPLPGESRRDSGHEIFHGAPAGGIACASCHPEGREDGRVWQFDGVGKRRTQSVTGGVLHTGALHWSGDLANFDALIDEVLVNRMAQAKPGPLHAQAFARWVDALPAPTPVAPTDPAAVAKGSALFHDPTIGCATCHSGEKLTNSSTADVGKGEKLKVPSLLGVGARAPFMHDGCAPTLTDRFGSCGGSSHGATSALTPEQVSALVAYMETL
ncbi:MAG: c-type cytochrome [Byssovorax sp.]